MTKQKKRHWLCRAACDILLVAFSASKEASLKINTEFLWLITFILRWVWSLPECLCPYLQGTRAHWITWWGRKITCYDFHGCQLTTQLNMYERFECRARQCSPLPSSSPPSKCQLRENLLEERTVPEMCRNCAVKAVLKACCRPALYYNTLCGVFL